jgi:hypothetical protein
MPLAWRFGRQNLGGYTHNSGLPRFAARRNLLFQSRQPFGGRQAGDLACYNLCMLRVAGRGWHRAVGVVHRLTAGLALVVSMGMLHDGLSRRAECCVHCRCDARPMVKTVVI